jgi:hypothetical protein
MAISSLVVVVGETTSMLGIPVPLVPVGKNLQSITVRQDNRPRRAIHFYRTLHFLRLFHFLHLSALSYSVKFKHVIYAQSHSL